MTARRVGIIQARMTSSRLPGKVLMPCAGRPLLSQQLARLRRCEAVDEFVLATTVNRTDDPLAAWAKKEGLPCVRGDEKDVLGRYVKAALARKADVVVRVTADCPLIDPVWVDRVVRGLTQAKTPVDYASNVIERTLPRGLDAEALWTDALLRLNRIARAPAAREHVTSFILREGRGLFLTAVVKDRRNNADLRWTVDTREDLEAVRAMFEGLGLPRKNPSYRDMVAYARRHPEISAVNAGVTQQS